VDVKEVISSGVIELYVLGIATEQEVQLVEDCIANHPEETLAEINAVEEALAANASSYATPPPAHLQQQIEDKIFGVDVMKNTTVETTTTHTKMAPVVKMPNRFKYAVAAGIALLLGSVITNIILFKKQESTNAAIASTQTKLAEQIAMNESINQQIGVVTNKDATTVALAGTEQHPEALAKIYWIKNTGDVYIDPTNLPEPPKGKQYQFWGIVDGKPVDGGMIFKNGKVKIEKLKTFGKAEAFAITLEKEGGVPQPTMAQLYVMAKT
jgi:anti-sigma-K factor RskA